MPVEREKPVPEDARSEVTFIVQKMVIRPSDSSMLLGIHVTRPSFSKEVNPDELQATWLGHAVSCISSKTCTL